MNYFYLKLSFTSIRSLNPLIDLSIVSVLPRHTNLFICYSFIYSIPPTLLHHCCRWPTHGLLPRTHPMPTPLYSPAPPASPDTHFIAGSSTLALRIQLRRSSSTSALVLHNKYINLLPKPLPPLIVSDSLLAIPPYTPPRPAYLLSGASHSPPRLFQNLTMHHTHLLAGASTSPANRLRQPPPFPPLIAGADSRLPPTNAASASARAC